MKKKRYLDGKTILWSLPWTAVTLVSALNLRALNWGADGGGLLAHGYGVHIHNTVDAVIFVFKCTPIFNGTEIIAYCKISRRLNAGKYYFFVI